MEQKQLETALERLHTQSFGWALRCCSDDREAAAEVLQNTYLKILEGKARFRETAAFKTWLFSVIRFTAADYYRRQSRRQRLKLRTPGIVHAETEAGPDADAPDRKEVFREGLNRLSPQQSQVLHLVFYQNCTIREASDIMGIQLGTARTHYERGKKQMKAWLLSAGVLKDAF